MPLRGHPLGRVDYDADGADEIILRCDGRALESSEGASLRIACARLWGASAASIRRRLTSERERLPPDDLTMLDEILAALLELAAIEPPLSLRPPDPPTTPSAE